MAKIQKWGNSVAVRIPAAIAAQVQLESGSPIEEVRDGVRTIAAAYEAAGAKDRFTYFIEAGAGHVLSDEMWSRTRATFDKHLG